jgi:hypothetical protein
MIRDQVADKAITKNIGASIMALRRSFTDLGASDMAITRSYTSRPRLHKPGGLDMGFGHVHFGKPATTIQGSSSWLPPLALCTSMY